ncbi:prolyl oligopeptidase family serine peptidase [Roseivirga sp.]|uniref:S9 family peptidase n=1 Tax=Roseivirga sp. TaxID=1964215 RepID=UPI003B51AD33
MLKQIRFLSISLVLTIFCGWLQAQNDKKLVTQQDAEKWETTSSTGFSKTGQWANLSIYRNDGSQQLIIKNLSDFSEKQVENGIFSGFSNNEQWAAYFIEPGPKEKEELEKAKKPVERKLILMNLASGDSSYLEKATRLSFSPSGNFAVLTMEKDKDDKSSGSQIIIQKLSDGSKFYFSNVGGFSWHDTQDLLAFTIDNKTKVGNGVQLFTPANGQIRNLITEEAEFSNPVWREKSNDLMVTQKATLEDLEEDSYHVLVWQTLNTKNENLKKLEAEDVTEMAEDHFITSSRSVRWMDDGRHILFEIFRGQKKSDLPQEEAEVFFNIDEAPEVEIWHTDVDQVLTQQQITSQKSDEQPRLVAWSVNSGTLTALEDDLVESVSFNSAHSIGLGRDNTPYATEARFGRGFSDLYTVDLNGAKTKVAEKTSAAYSLSPGSEYMVYAKDEKLFLYHVKEQRSQELALPAGHQFFNMEDDHPAASRRAYGFSAWSEDGKTAIINSQYDLWLLEAKSGQLTQLTNGLNDKLQHRLISKDWRNPEFKKGELLISLFSDITKDEGYGTLVPDKEMKTIAFEPRSLGSFVFPEEGEAMMYVKQNFDESPNRFYRPSPSGSETQLTETNPQQSDFYWTKAELITYTNYAGKELQAILYYPANYEAGKKYPMVTYIYEKLSSGFHSYPRPRVEDYYNTGFFTQNGYFVLRPDIEFKASDPGRSSARSLEAVVGEVVKMGLVDEKRVGLVGHSWGGYQAAFVPTETDIFAASVAGAGLTNLVSMYGAITPAFGGAPESGHFEVSQERMVQPPYEIPEAYMLNSAVTNVHKLNTPILLEAGDNDMNVNMRQSVEYYNAARRAGKEMVMLVYAKEGHGLRNKKNMVDYHNRIMQWFGHYLKGDPAPIWMKEAQSYAEQQRMLKNWDKYNGKEDDN